MGLSKMSGRPLSQPTFPNSACPCAYLSALKKFCGGLLEGSKNHEWRPIIRTLSKRRRLTIAASLFLFRKVLPTPSADLGSYLDRMSIESPEPDAAFLSFCRRKISYMFRDGWDYRYGSVVSRSILPVSSCVERGMSDGGQRAMPVLGLWSSREDYVKDCLTASSAPTLVPSKVVCVKTGGKSRIVSVPGIDMNRLRPLHTIFYDHLSRQSWLLRGDATRKRFSDFRRVPGELFYSGDYESATDNLNTKVQEFILREVLSHCRSVPQGVVDLAVSSLHMKLKHGSRVVEQRRGQLMGNLLSFPLLCLVNFLAFKYAVPRKVPLKINGDDIVFRATREEGERWVSLVGKSGLVLSKGKTMIDPRFFSLNSRFFEGTRAARRSCLLVPVIRSKAAFGCVDEGVLSIGSRFQSFAEGFNRADLAILHGFFLRVNRRFIVSSGRSLSALGLRVDQSIIESEGFIWRERQYISVTGRYIEEVPLQDVVRSCDPYKIDGWKNIPYPKTKASVRWARDHAEAVREAVWQRPVKDPNQHREELRAKIKETGRDLGQWVRDFRSRVAKLARFTGMSKNACHRYLSPYLRLPQVVHRQKVITRYCPDGTPSRNILFLGESGEWLARGGVEARSIPSSDPKEPRTSPLDYFPEMDDPVEEEGPPRYFPFLHFCPPPRALLEGVTIRTSPWASLQDRGVDYYNLPPPYNDRDPVAG